MSNKSIFTPDMPDIIVPFGPLPPQSMIEVHTNPIKAPLRKRGPAGRETSHPIVISYPKRAVLQAGSDAAVAGQGSATSRSSTKDSVTEQQTTGSSLRLENDKSRLPGSAFNAPVFAGTAHSSPCTQNVDVRNQQKVN